MQRALLVAWLALSERSVVTKSEIQNISVPNYHIIRDSDSNAVFTVQNASDYCRTQFGTSLASYHSTDQLLNITTHISRSDEYWMGLFCESSQQWYLNNEPTGNEVIQFAYKDGTSFDLGSVMIDGLSRCHQCSTMYWRGPRVRLLVKEDCSRNTASGFVCNAHSDADWQDMNPPRPSATVKCEGNRECTLQCDENTPCIRYTNHSLSEMTSLSVRCSDQFVCYGMNVSIHDVGSVSFVGSADQSLLHSGLFIRRVQELSLQYLRHEAGHSSVLSLKVARNVDVQCHSWMACAGSLFQIVNVSNSTVITSPNSYAYLATDITVESSQTLKVRCSNPRGDAAVRSCSGLRLTASRIQSWMQLICPQVRSCADSTITVRESGDVSFHCLDGLETCGNVIWMLDQVSEFTVVCKGRSVCLLKSNSIGISDVGSMRMHCIGTESCLDWRNQGNQNRATMVGKLQIECDGHRACHLPMIDQVIVSEDWTVICRSKGSCGMRSSVNSSRHRFSNQRLSVRCLGFESCVRTEEESADYVSDVMLWLRNMSIIQGYTQVSLLCDGRSACKDTLINMAPNTEVSVQCGESDASCGGAEINGFCAARLSVEIASVVSGLSVVCPNEESGECEIDVKRGAQMKEGSIQMSEKDWRKQKNEIRGDSDAYSAVSTVHSSGDTRSVCSSELGEFKYGSVECFLEHLDGTREWLESQVCRDFVLSLYSPISISILSATFVFLCLFIVTAIGRSGQSDLSSFSVAFSALFSFVAFSALAGSAVLFAFELDVRSTINDTTILPDLDESFQWFALLNTFLFVMMLMSMQIHILLNVSLPFLRALQPRLKSERKLRTAVVLVCSVKMAQMLLVYVIVSVGVPVPIALTVCFTLEILSTSVDPRFLKSWLMTGLVWFFLSRFSPMSVLFSELGTQRSFLEVIGASDSKLEAVFIWFDLVLIELMLGFTVLIWTRPNTSQKLKVFSLLSQLLDYSTDIAVIVFWMTSQRYLWASLELSFVLSAALITWFQVRSELQSWMDHAFVLCGLGRGYCNMKVWNGEDGPWMWISNVSDEVEKHFESYPSIVLGLYLIMSDWWSAYLNEDSIAGTASLGPLMFSLFFTANSIAMKDWKKCFENIVKPGRLKLRGTENGKVTLSLLFLFTLSDFLCRSIPLCMVLSMSQGGDSNSHASPALIAVFCAVMTVLVAEHGSFLKYHGHCSVMMFPSVVSATPMFFSCFPSSLHPSSLFPFHSFLRFHSVILGQSLTIMVICVIINHQIITQLTSFCFSFTISFAINSVVSLLFLCGSDLSP